jgi:hypothetical protein
MEGGGGGGGESLPPQGQMRIGQGKRFGPGKSVIQAISLSRQPLPFGAPRGVVTGRFALPTGIGDGSTPWGMFNTHFSILSPFVGRCFCHQPLFSSVQKTPSRGTVPAPLA